MKQVKNIKKNFIISIIFLFLTLLIYKILDITFINHCKYFIEEITMKKCVNMSFEATPFGILIWINFISFFILFIKLIAYSIIYIINKIKNNES